MIPSADVVDYLIQMSKLDLLDHPRDDLTPLLMVEDGTKVTLCPLMGNVHPHDMLLAIADKIRTELQPVRLSLRTDTYMTNLDPDTGERIEGSRREAVAVNVVSIEGQSTTMLEYHRKPDGVTFGEPKTSDETDGRLVDALRTMLVTHSPSP